MTQSLPAILYSLYEAARYFETVEAKLADTPLFQNIKNEKIRVFGRSAKLTALRLNGLESHKKIVELKKTIFKSDPIGAELLKEAAENALYQEYQTAKKKYVVTIKNAKTIGCSPYLLLFFLLRKKFNSRKVFKKIFTTIISNEVAIREQSFLFFKKYIEQRYPPPLKSPPSHVFKKRKPKKSHRIISPQPQ